MYFDNPQTSSDEELPSNSNFKNLSENEASKTPSPYKVLENNEESPKVTELNQIINDQHQTINDLQSEILALRSQLDTKNSELNRYQILLESFPTLKKNSKLILKPQSYAAKSIEPEESNFWRTKGESPDKIEAIKFEEIAASRELWIMSLEKNDKSKSTRKILQSPDKGADTNSKTQSAKAKFHLQQENNILRKIVKRPGHQFPLIRKRSQSLMKSPPKKVTKSLDKSLDLHN